MGLFRPREEEDDEGIPVSLQQKACPQCRRTLQPWENVCPEDGSAPISKVDLPAVQDQAISLIDPALLLGLDEEIAADEGPKPDEPI